MRGYYHREVFIRQKASTSIMLHIFEMMNFRFLYVITKNTLGVVMMGHIVK